MLGFSTNADIGTVGVLRERLSGCCAPYSLLICTCAAFGGFFKISSLTRYPWFRLTTAEPLGYIQINKDA